MKLSIFSLLFTLALFVRLAGAQSVLLNPTGNQTVSQPSATALSVNNFSVTGAPSLESLRGVVSVTDYGAIGNGTTDDTTAITNAISAVATAGGTVLFPYGAAGNYLISSEITIPASVNLLGWTNGAGGQIKITGDFDGFLFEVNATGGSLIQGLAMTNSYWSGTQGNSGVLHVDGISGPFVLRDDAFSFNDTGILATGQLISWQIENTILDGDSGTNGQSRCISAFGNNSHFLGGRAYGCHIAYDLSGDDWKLDSVDGEFNDIIIRTQALGGMTVINSHFESSGMLWTNATTLPTTTTYPWTDNGGNGIGWSGTIRFMNCSVFFNAYGSGNPQEAPLFVVKTQPEMSGRLVIDGNNFSIAGTSISPNFFSLSTSFNYTVTPALVSGVKVISWDPINIPTIPVDSYTGWTNLSAGISLLGPPIQYLQIGAGSYAIASTNQPAEFVGTITTTASSSDSLPVTSLPAGAHCSAQAENGIAGSLTGSYVPTVATAGTVVMNHPTGSSGAVFSIFCAFE